MCDILDSEVKTLYQSLRIPLHGSGAAVYTSVTDTPPQHRRHTSSSSNSHWRSDSSSTDSSLQSTAGIHVPPPSANSVGLALISTPAGAAAVGMLVLPGMKHPSQPPTLSNAKSFPLESQSVRHASSQVPTTAAPSRVPLTPAAATPPPPPGVVSTPSMLPHPPNKEREASKHRQWVLQDLDERIADRLGGLQNRRLQRGFLSMRCSGATTPLSSALSRQGSLQRRHFPPKLTFLYNEIPPMESVESKDFQTLKSSPEYHQQGNASARLPLSLSPSFINAAETDLPSSSAYNEIPNNNADNDNDDSERFGMQQAVAVAVQRPQTSAGKSTGTTVQAEKFFPTSVQDQTDFIVSPRTQSTYSIVEDIDYRDFLDEAVYRPKESQPSTPTSSQYNPSSIYQDSSNISPKSQLMALFQKFKDPSPYKTSSTNKSEAPPKPFRGMATVTSPKPFNLPLPNGDLKINSAQTLSTKDISDTASLWFRPHFTRQEVNAYLVDKEPGSFVIRLSTSKKNAYDLAIKVNKWPSYDTNYSEDQSNSVRHFLIESTGRGVRLLGNESEPYFSSLASLLYQHCLSPLSLPCLLKVMISPLEAEAATSMPSSSVSPDSYDVRSGDRDSVPLNRASLQVTGSHRPGGGGSGTVADNSTVAKGTYFYLATVNVEELNNWTALDRAITSLLEQPQSVRQTECSVTVSSEGLTLTDKWRKVFFRHHFVPSAILYCEADRRARPWKSPELVRRGIKDAKMLGIVVRGSSQPTLSSTSTSTVNQCFLLCECDPNYPVKFLLNAIFNILLIQPK